jgi:hypothetical protein
MDEHQIHSDVALLAPVPLEHLVSALETCRAEGEAAFGSRDFAAFRKLDELAAGLPCDVFIYASDAPTRHAPAVSWKARYVKTVETSNGRHPDGMRYRPQSTAAYKTDNLGHWAVFWEVADLRRLGPGDAIPISKLRSVGSKTNLKSAAPRGPLVIDSPE